jgi:hypothetical protein
MNHAAIRTGLQIYVRENQSMKNASKKPASKSADKKASSQGSAKKKK